MVFLACAGPGACSSQGEGDRGHGRQEIPADGTGDGAGDGLGELGGPGGMGPGQTVWEGDPTCASCMESRAGTGGAPFDPEAHDSENVSVDPDGALVLELGGGSGAGYIWISNSGEDTVAKINTDTYVEEGRYKLVGTDGIGSIGRDPSRTSVDLSGDAYVGSRDGHALTRVSVKGDACPDTNGDGVVTTSHGPTEILPFGQDDCVRWQTELMGTIRGVAVQEFPAETMVTQVPDGPPIITEKPGNKFVWVGNTESQLWKIDAETGAIVIAMTAPAPVYGLALSGDGRLWISSGPSDGTAMGVVDTKQCVDDASCGVAPCQVACVGTQCPADCDGAALARIEMGPQSNYGITVDCKQRVWLTSLLGAMRRYDPAAPAGTRLVLAVPPGAPPESLFAASQLHGVGADRHGWVWGAGMIRVTRIHQETFESAQILPAEAKGIAIDSRGKVWGVGMIGSAIVIEPGPGVMDNPIVHTQAGLVQPYTYSDMTGQQLRNATNAPGHYRHLFEGCAAGGALGTEWFDLSFDVETPAGSWVVFSVRAGNTPEELASALWVQAAAVPGVSGHVPITPYIRGSTGGSETPRYVEVEVKLVVDDAGAGTPDRCAEGVSVAGSPRVKAFTLSYSCGETVE